MSHRQDLRIELEEFLRSYRFQIEQYVDDLLDGDDDFVSCNDCGESVYAGGYIGDIKPADIVQSILEIISDRIHTDEDLKMLAAAGQAASNILDKTRTKITPTEHKQFDDAMKGLT